MCTLTWWQGTEGRYEVFFNRDELKEREPALPPRQGESGGLRILAPLDPRAGGTWLMANEAGLTLAILNWYEKAGEPDYLPEWGSRGALVLDLGAAVSMEALRERMTAIHGGDYPPFRLFAFAFASAGDGLAVESWQGRGAGPLEAIPAAMPECSSSLDPAATLAWRRRVLRSLAPEGEPPDPETLWAFHHGAGDPEAPGLLSARMIRPEAQTWSISRVSVSADQVRFLYEAEPLNLAGPTRRHEAILARRTPLP